MQPNTPESPTGTPVVPPSRVPLWLVIAVTLSAGFTAAGQLLPDEYSLARTICTILGVAFAAGIGVASPGLRRHGGHLVVLVGLAFLLQGCAALQRPAPIGEPSPLACYGAKRTREAWEDLVRKYVDEMMAAQEQYSCQPLPPAQPAAR